MTVILDTDPYYVGQRVLLEIEFRLLGVPTDPTIVQITAKDPSDGSNITLTYPDVDLIRRDVGLFEAAFVVSSGGQWHFRVDAAGVVDAVTETSLEVLASMVI
jgi:hypothetical protein